MKKILLLTLTLFIVACQSNSTVSEEDSQIFEKNVQFLKDTWIQGYEQENFEQAISFMADSIQWHAPAGGSVGIESLKESVQFWLDNFEDISFTEGEGLPGTDVGFWGGNTYPVSEAMAGPNNVRMYGTWRMTNSNTGKSASVKSYCVLSFNEDGKVHSVTEYGYYGNVNETYE
jgi:hypothetical protein|tara:strand:- start:148 stop:669 length:522 start_codon:yes stop_codon:yes gene_type:complete